MEVTQTNCWHIDDALARYDAPALQVAVDLQRPFAGLQQLVDSRPHDRRHAANARRRPQRAGTVDAEPRRVVRPGPRPRRHVSANPRPTVSTASLLARGRRRPRRARRRGRVHRAANFDQHEPARHGAGRRRRQSAAGRRSGRLAGLPRLRDAGAPRGAAWSYVQIVHPVDHAHPCSTTATPAGLQLRARLFGRYLEKGVIMRARVRGADRRSRRDEAAATALYNDFLHAPLPLTT